MQLHEENIVMEKTNIFIVEDEAIVAMDLKRCLLSLDYDVSCIFNKAENCIEMCRKKRPDIVLMDIVLKGDIDGIKASEILRKLNIPVVFLTSHADDYTFQRAKQTSPYGFIIKPYESKDLKVSIDLAMYKWEMENKLAKSELKYKSLFLTSTDAVMTIDENGVISSVNPASEKMFGYSPGEITGRPLKNLIPNAFLNQRATGLKRLIGNAAEMVGDVIELQGKRKTGEIFPVELSFSQWEFSGAAQYTLNIRDITWRKQQEQLNAEHAKEEIQRQKAGDAMIIREIEQERKRISRELHDGIGQMLSAVKLNVELYEKMSGASDNNLISAKNLLSEAGRELKNIIYAIHPIIIDNYGLTAAVGKLSRDFEETSAIKMNFTALGDVRRLPSESELTIYRIIQEALNNIVKHSYATEAELEIAFNPDEIRIKISDNGIGFETEKYINEKNSTSFGLKNMQQRVSMLNGEFLINSSPDCGVTIKINIYV
jgi:PAS domain S-box-containing protein